MGTTARFGNVKGLRKGRPKECGDGEGCVATPQVGGMPGLGATKVVRNEATKGPREWLSIYTGGQTSGRRLRPVAGDARRDDPFTVEPRPWSVNVTAPRLGIGLDLI